MRKLRFGLCACPEVTQHLIHVLKLHLHYWNYIHMHSRGRQIIVYFMHVCMAFNLFAWIHVKFFHRCLPQASSAWIVFLLVRKNTALNCDVVVASSVRRSVVFGLSNTCAFSLTVGRRRRGYAKCEGSRQMFWTFRIWTQNSNDCFHMHVDRVSTAWYSKSLKILLPNATHGISSTWYHRIMTPRPRQGVSFMSCLVSLTPFE